MSAFPTQLLQMYMAAEAHRQHMCCSVENWEHCLYDMAGTAVIGYNANIFFVRHLHGSFSQHRPEMRNFSNASVKAVLSVLW